MGSKPFLKTVKVEIPRGEDGFWSIILKLGAEGPFTIGDVVGQTNVASGTVSGYCRRLIKGGYIVPAGERPHPLPCSPPCTLYRLEKPVELPPLLDRNGKERPEPQNELIWRTIKMVRTFTARELAEEIAPNDADAKLVTVRSYLYQLHRVGIIAQVGGGQRSLPNGGRTEARYRLVENLGARAPRILSTKIVFDPNAGAIVGQAQAKEAAR